MACSGAFAANYFFWVGLSGIFAGCAVSRLTKSHREERARRWKWIAISAYLSLAVLLWLCSVFVPSTVCDHQSELRRYLLDIRLLYFFIAALVLAFLGMRFKRVAGIPLIVILSVAATAAISLRHPWGSLDVNTPIAEFRILAIQDNRKSVEFTAGCGDPVFVEIVGEGVTVGVRTLRTGDYYFFTDKPYMYRFAGLYSASSPEGTSDLSSRSVDNFATRYQRWIQRLATRLPGWQSELLEIRTERLLPFFKYAVFLGDDNDLRIELIRPNG